ncbi:hypothetical protein F5Y16DRAFT_388080 [Xylariaceae sp. FL0255]|nr:hypothetical protein F5Y16DRAFT_388080 [Xylariaceae sp. FL0255]
MPDTLVRSLGGRCRMWAFFLSLISTMLFLNVLLSGTGHVTTASYLNADTTNLNLPAKLASSVFLQDLSKISGGDLVGQSRNSESLSLSSTYDVSLLTTCGQSPKMCFPSQVGFVFNPETDLKLDIATTTTTLPTTFVAEMNRYEYASRFIATVYIIAIPLELLSAVLIFMSSAEPKRPIPRMMLAARITSALAAALMLANMIAGIVTFTKLHNTFNATFGDLGINTTLASSAIGFSVAAMVLSTTSFVLLLISRGPGKTREQQQQRQRNRQTGPYKVSIESLSAVDTSKKSSKISTTGRRILDRVPTWNKPTAARNTRYVPIGPIGAGASDRSNQLLTPANSPMHASSRLRSPSPESESDRDGLVAAVDSEYEGGGYGEGYEEDEEDLRGRPGVSAIPGHGGL